MLISEMFGLGGQKAIVSGGTRGIGRAAVEIFHEFGAEVVVIGRSDVFDSDAEKLSAKGPAVHVVKADVSDRYERRKAFDEAIGKLGTVDILVNSAGIASDGPSQEFPQEIWDKTLEVNLTASFELCRLSSKYMLEKGKGKIINIGSLHSVLGKRNITAYAASKGAVALLTRSLAHEWSAKGIHVNAILPGFIETDLNTDFRNDPVEYPKTLDRLPMGRWGKPEDLKGAFVFLASRASDYVTGELLAVDGGILAV